jgi:hypothetical protein
MTLKMGLEDVTKDGEICEEGKLIEKPNHLIPEKPILSKEEFAAITSYIVALAPDTRSRSFPIE